MEIIKKNWKLKLLSLALAIFLWSFIIASMNPTVKVRLNDIPISYVNTEHLGESELILDTNTQKTISVLVSGQRSNVVNLTPQHIRVTADFSEVEEGLNTVPLDYTAPEGITVDEYIPSISVTADKIISREMVVEINSLGNLQDNYIVQSTLISPETVSVRGARTVVDTIDKLVVDLSLPDLTKNTSANREIRAIDANGNVVSNVTLGQQFVNLNVFVDLQKELEIEPNTIGNLGEDLRLEDMTLNRTTAFVQGPEEVLSQIESVETQEINLAEITENTTVPLKLNLPNDIRLVDETNEFSINISVQNKTEKSLMIPSNSINITGTQTQYQYDITDTEVEVKSKGFNDQIENITEQDISLTIDVSGVGVGTHVVVPKITSTELDLTLFEEIAPITINVTQNEN